MSLLCILLYVCLGTALGSFINVLAIRYNPDKGFSNVGTMRGRSRCMSCLKTLRWFELIPIVSFVIQRRRCRSCRATLSWQYPLVEALSGLLAVGLALRFSGPELVIWSIATFVFVLISVIDARLKIIPDGLNSFIVFLGIISIIIASTTGNFGPVKGSLIGHHALLFGIRDNIWLNHFFGAGLALLLFVAVVIISRGRGMGLGDVKLAAAAGVLMGWPDIVFALMIAFISGSLWGIVSIFLGRKTMKSIIPFGPFIVLGIMVIALFGEPIFDSYFRFIDTLIT